MPQLHAVTFDLWHTLMKDSPEVGRERFRARMDGIQKLLAEAEVHTDYEQLRAASRACFRACEGIRDQGRELSFHDQVDLFLNLLRPGLAKQLPKRLYRRIAEVYGSLPKPHLPEMAPGAPEVLRALKGQDLPLALISNTGVTPGTTLRALLDEFGLLEHLDHLVFSDEVGLVKPNEKIFHLTLEKLGVKAEHAAHVGDHPEADVQGAKKAGMLTVQVNSTVSREQVEEPHAKAATLKDVPEALEKLRRE
jgi:putative hydrolase of the HAD superfamily